MSLRLILREKGNRVSSCLVMNASFILNCYSTNSKVVDSLQGHKYDVPGSYSPY